MNALAHLPHIIGHKGRTPDSLLTSLYACTDVAERFSIRAALEAHYGCPVRFSTEGGAL